jgi:WD40 repeat protein
LSDFLGRSRNMVTFDADRAVRLWRPAPTLAPKRFDAMPRWNLLSGPTSQRMQKALSPRSAPPTLNLVYPESAPVVVASSEDGIRLFAAGNEQPTQSIDPVKGAFDANGRTMAYVAQDGSVMTLAVGAEVWQPIGTATNKGSPLLDGATGVLVASQRDDDKGGKMSLVEGFGLAGVPSLPAALSGQSVLAVSARDLLTASKSAGVVLVPLPASAGKPVALPLADGSSPVQAGALSPYAGYAAVLQENGTVSVWNTDRAALVALFGEADQRLVNIAFPPDGDAIDAVGQDGTVYRWPLLAGPDVLNEMIENAIPRDITDNVRRQIIESATAAAMPPAAQ